MERGCVEQTELKRTKIVKAPWTQQRLLIKFEKNTPKLRESENLGSVPRSEWGSEQHRLGVAQCYIWIWGKWLQCPSLLWATHHLCSASDLLCNMGRIRIYPH